MRFVALFLACLFLALAVVGVVLPGVPTVHFLLLAAWFSAKGSTRLHRWLHTHPHFGRQFTDWRTRKAISRRSEFIAVSMMTLSWAFMLYRLDNVWLLTGAALFFVAVASYLMTRPDPREL